MKENKYDELDKLFRSKLKNETPAENGWNLPPMSVLDEALAQIPEEKEERRPVFWWLFGAGALLVVSAFVLYNFSRIDRLEDSINSQNSISETNQQMVVTEENDISTKENIEETIPNETIETKEDVFSSKSTRSVTTNSIKSINKSFKSKTLAPNRSKDVQSSAHSNSSPVKLKNSFISDAIVSNSPSVVGNNEKEEINVQALSHLSLHMFNTNYERAEVVLKTEKSTYNKEQVSDLTSSLYLFAGANFSSLAMSNVEAMPSSLVDYDKRYLAYQLGFGWSLPMTDRLSLNLESSYQRLMNKSVYKSLMDYNSSNEVVGMDGMTYYDATMDIQSPMGSYLADFRFAVDDVAMTDDDVMDNKTKLTQIFHVVNLSAALEYKILSLGNIDINLNGGFGANYLYALNQEMDAAIYFGQKTLMSEKYETTDVPEKNNLFFTAFANVSADYHWTDKWSTGLYLGYERGLTSMRSKSQDTDPSTYLNTLRAGMNFKYSF